MPTFKKLHGKIFGVQFNAKEQETINREIMQQVLENDRKYSINQEAAVLWMLHTRFGFGQKRLEEAWSAMYEEKETLRKHYEMDEQDSVWICLRQLKEIGCDIEEWYRKQEKERGATG